MESDTPEIDAVRVTQTGQAAPEIVHHWSRLLRPLRRTRPEVVDEGADVVLRGDS